MRYTMADIEQRAGVTSRTIREYMRLGLLDPPERKGLGATYSEEQLLTAVAVARMRAQGKDWEEISGQVPAWSLQKLRAFVKKTDPAPAQPSPTETTSSSQRGGGLSRPVELKRGCAVVAYAVAPR